MFKTDKRFGTSQGLVRAYVCVFLLARLILIREKFVNKGSLCGAPFFFCVRIVIILAALKEIYFYACVCLCLSLCVCVCVSLSRVGPELVWIPSVWTNLCKVYLRAAHNKNYNERNLTPSAGDATITTCSQGGFSNDSNNKQQRKQIPAGKS